MDQPPDHIGVPFEPTTEQARLRKVSRPMLRLIFHGTIAATPPSPGRSFAIGYILRHLGQRSNGTSNANHPPAATSREGLPMSGSAQAGSRA